jgi:hypothetical protein
METINFMGHQFKVKKESKSKSGWSGADRVVLSCIPHCCTAPFGIEISMPESELENFKTAASQRADEV